MPLSDAQYRAAFEGWIDRAKAAEGDDLAAVLTDFFAWAQKLAGEPAPYPIPGPYEIALQVGAAAVQSGRFENIGAALHAAWVAVPEFYNGRDFYVQTLAPMIYGVSPPEGSPAYDETRDPPA